MFARLSRLFRAWMGFFISQGEDPEVMLQDAIEEMRITMPKLNSVLVATRATVIRLEEEHDGLLRLDEDIVAAELADLRHRLLAGALADAEHRHDAADAEHDAEHRQHRPQLVQQQVLDAEADVAGKFQAHGRE